MATRKKKSSFTFMVVGRKALGKTSFINTLFSSKIAGRDDSKDINMYELDIECEGLLKHITAIDSPGFGFNLDDTELYSSIISFIKLQYDKFLAEETKVRRNALAEDSRIHCLLYFMAPCVYGLKEADITFLKMACQLVNIIIVIGKADALTKTELEMTRRRIKEQVAEHQIKLFDLPSATVVAGNSECLLEHRIPFGLVCGEDKIRRYDWGCVEVDNTEHCDFQILKEIMLSTASEIMKEATEYELYEDYRTEVLTSLLPDGR